MRQAEGRRGGRQEALRRWRGAHHAKHTRAGRRADGHCAHAVELVGQAHAGNGYARGAGAHAGRRREPWRGRHARASAENIAADRAELRERTTRAERGRLRGRRHGHGRTWIQSGLRQRGGAALAGACGRAMAPRIGGTGCARCVSDDYLPRRARTRTQRHSERVAQSARRAPAGTNLSLRRGRCRGWSSSWRLRSRSRAQRRKGVCVGGGGRGGVVMRCDVWGQGVVRGGGSLRQLCVGSRVCTAHVAGRVARAAAALLRSTPRGHMAQRTGCRGGMRGGVAERGDPRASRTPGAPRRARTRGPHGAATRGGAFPPAGKKKNASPALDRPATATAAAAPADAHTVAGITVLPPARAAAEPSPAPGPACAQQRLPLPPACPRASAWAR